MSRASTCLWRVTQLRLLFEWTIKRPRSANHSISVQSASSDVALKSRCCTKSKRSSTMRRGRHIISRTFQRSSPSYETVDVIRFVNNSIYIVGIIFKIVLLSVVIILKIIFFFVTKGKILLESLCNKWMQLIEVVNVQLSIFRFTSH